MSMQVFSGTGVAPGIGIGRAVSIRALPVDVFQDLSSREGSRQRNRTLRELIGSGGSRDLRQTEAQVRRKLGEDLAGIFEAHSLLLRDREFTGRITNQIKSERINAEWAIHRVLTDLGEQFRTIEAPHLRDKIEDLRDVGRYLVRCLQGVSAHDLSEMDGNLVIVAHDLTPSDAVRLGRSQVVGFVLESGGRTSHTAIIARALGCALVVGVEGIGTLVADDDPVVVDGAVGKLFVHPTEAVLERYRRRANELEQQDIKLQETRDLEAVTSDGTRVHLMANIELPEEIEDAKRFGAEGIGLYRSEFLYIEKSPELPTEEEHLAVYRRFLEEMGPGPVVIRTYDLGGRKLAREVMETNEDNPVLGLRGIRLTMARPKIFRVQLRALLRAGVYGDLWLMLPMVSSVEEIRRFRHSLGSLMQELETEDVPYNKNVKLGTMIEVPSAALMADVMAKEVDFFSIGTNDLVQYALAVDRNNEHVAYLHQPLHPAILRMIRFVCASADAAGIDVSLCGEMAADQRNTPLLLGLGLRSLSMSPRRVPAVKSRIRQLDLEDMQDAAMNCLQLGTAQEVEEYLDARFGAVPAFS